MAAVGAAAILGATESAGDIAGADAANNIIDTAQTKAAADKKGRDDAVQDI
jgi:hypothetical protein